MGGWAGYSANSFLVFANHIGQSETRKLFFLQFLAILQSNTGFCFSIYFSFNISFTIIAKFFWMMEIEWVRFRFFLLTILKSWTKRKSPSTIWQNETGPCFFRLFQLQYFVFHYYVSLTILAGVLEGVSRPHGSVSEKKEDWRAGGCF
jgi:hypothetical protein